MRSGTGACGLYAAGIGASRVILTDSGEEPVLNQLLARNVDANRHLLPSSIAEVRVAPLRWGDDAALNALCRPGGSQDGSDGFDLVLASDITYHWTPHDDLAHTCACLMISCEDAR